jgi:hypothetical protein
MISILEKVLRTSQVSSTSSHTPFTLELAQYKQGWVEEQLIRPKLGMSNL